MGVRDRPVPHRALVAKVGSVFNGLVTPRIDGKLFLAFAQRTRLCSWCPQFLAFRRFNGGGLPRLLP